MDTAVVRAHQVIILVVHKLMLCVVKTISIAVLKAPFVKLVDVKKYDIQLNSTHIYSKTEFKFNNLNVFRIKWIIP